MFRNQRFRAGSFPVPESQPNFPQDYKSVKEQLERQTIALLNERKNIQNSPSFASDQTFIHHEVNRPNSHKDFNHGAKSHLSSRIREINKMCAQDKIKLKKDFEKMTDAEKEILSILKHNKPEKLQLQNYEVKRPEKKTYQRQKTDKYRKSAIDDLKTDRNVEPNEIGSNFQNVREKLEQKTGFSDDVLMMIDAIERKALLEINDLKKQNSELRAKLNKEMSAHNQEKKIRMSLQSKFRSGGSESYGSPRQQIPLTENENLALQEILEEDDPQLLKQKIIELVKENKKFRNYFNYHHSRNKSDGSGESHYLQSQISLLEKKLYEYQVEINRLRGMQAGNLDIALLYEQGQNIRKQTLNLLRRQGLLSSESQKVIKHLQNRLDEQESSKKQFFKDLERFKQEYFELEEENRRLKGFDDVRTQRPFKSHHTRATAQETRMPSSFKVNSRLGQYEALIGEIKRVSA